MNERSYWNSNGEAQALYDEMQAAAFKYTKATGALLQRRRPARLGAEPPGRDAIQPRERIRPQCADRRGRGRI